MRKITQICATGHAVTQSTQSEYTVVVLCDDGTMWEIKNRENSVWQKYPEIPQDEVAITEGHTCCENIEFGECKICGRPE